MEAPPDALTALGEIASEPTTTIEEMKAKAENSADFECLKLCDTRSDASHTK